MSLNRQLNQGQNKRQSTSIIHPDESNCSLWENWTWLSSSPAFLGLGVILAANVRVQRKFLRSRGSLRDIVIHEVSKQDIRKEALDRAEHPTVTLCTPISSPCRTKNRCETGAGWLGLLPRTLKKNAGLRTKNC